jgi:hypothetical protein
VIFESNQGSEREPLFNFLTEHGYTVDALPWTGNPRSRSLTRQEFAMHHQTNFAAVPAKNEQKV